MSKELPFLIYCIEEYKSQKGISGKEVIDIFSKYNISQYLYACYDALHTTGANYIVNDIDSLIEERI
ncbi:DUF3791 domain-containing protein [Anaerosinus gibii]|uniref:DUF3791 domain-containing protein n=1 Tax=Selenobaculum gibii TaxID=3054208 RepID=A0A9Y2AH58_9FIRM|nr:DUF3791 domain-containing protein [Selenobaculum gbiensis]WIW69863.1 DUF3791 domain-containing protein [Selenobaculum gbiensis]